MKSDFRQKFKNGLAGFAVSERFLDFFCQFGFNAFHPAGYTSVDDDDDDLSLCIMLSSMKKVLHEDDEADMSTRFISSDHQFMPIPHRSTLTADLSSLLMALLGCQTPLHQSLCGILVG